MRICRRWVAALLLMSMMPALSATRARAGEDGVLVLETTVFHSEERAREQFGRLKRYLEERTGLRFKLLIAPDYDTASQDVRRGDADLALLSPLLTCKTRRWVPDVRYVATTKISEEGSYYDSVVFALADGPIRSLADARGEAIALVSEESSAGYLFPLAGLLARGIDPYRHFRKIYLVGTHKATVEALEQGSVAVAAAFPAALSETGPEDRFRILARSDKIPAASLMASPFFAEEHFEAIQAALLAPDYLERVFGGDADAEAARRAYPDYGWQLLPHEVVDAPCRVGERLREARKSSGEVEP